MTRVMVAQVFYWNRDYAKAIAECEDLFNPVSAASPGSQVYYLSLSLSGQGRRALTELRASAPPPDGSPSQALLGYLEARHGYATRARATQQRLLNPPTGVYISPLTIALISVGLGGPRAGLPAAQGSGGQARPGRDPGGGGAGLRPVARGSAVRRRSGRRRPLRSQLSATY